ncbi:DUF6355 family natural product biosynthesis protein [Actinosynnema sp. NPDC020468]|uniref:DUF6355 family natural product biosynthesis protein n=1 Tax=Actinosynnema sp. NPDC020468 TaxID=3154488 RepID=UPI0034116041
MRALRAAAVLGMATLGLVFTGVSAIASPAAQVGEVAGSATNALLPNPCGFWEDHTTAYYTHCGTNCIWIIVDYSSGPNEYKKIFGNGTVDIGGAAAVDNAWYSHVC